MAGHHYEKVVKLGSGSYGNVWLVVDKSCNQNFVLKEINLRGLDDKDLDQAMAEIQILSKCKHQHIISYCASFINKEVPTLSIVMEHASMGSKLVLGTHRDCPIFSKSKMFRLDLLSGDLHQQITDRRGLYFTDEVILKWFSHLVSALKYIHTKCILHRDVKPQNLFLTSKQTLKLGDFGISRMFSNHKDKANTLIGTPFYLSPEVCRQESYSYASDMWASGCVLYEMCCLCVPFTASNMAVLAAKIELAQYHPLPAHCSEILHKLVQSLLTPDPQKRLTAEDIYEMDLVHPKHAVDSTTYTIVKHPKKTRPSLASPELSAMLHKQRTQTLEGQRAVQSAGNPHRNPRHLLHRKEKRSASPCFNLFQNECVDGKRLRTDDRADSVTTPSSSDILKGLDSLIKEVYKSYSSLTPGSDSLTANVIRNSLMKLLGHDVFQDMLMAVRKKAELEELEKISHFSIKILPLFLCYIKMTN